MLEVYSDTIKFPLSATVQDQGNSGSFQIRAEERELRPGSLELWEDGSRVGWGDGGGLVGVSLGSQVQSLCEQHWAASLGLCDWKRSWQKVRTLFQFPEWELH